MANCNFNNTTDIFEKITYSYPIINSKDEIDNKQLHNYIKESLTNMCNKLGITDKSTIDSLIERNYETIKLDAQNIEIKKVNVLDVDDEIMVIQGDLVKEVIYDAMNERYKATENGGDISLEDVLLYSNKRYIRIGECIQVIEKTNSPSSVEKIKIAQYIKNMCPMQLLFNLVYKKDRTNVRINGNTIEVLRQYLRKAYHIYNSKYILFEEDKLPDIDNIGFELIYLNNIVDVPLAKYYDYINKCDIDLSGTAKIYDIHILDLVYRLCKGYSLDDAIELGIKDRVNYNLHYYSHIGDSLLNKNTITNIGDILIKLIKEEIMET